MPNRLAYVFWGLIFLVTLPILVQQVAFLWVDNNFGPVPMVVIAMTFFSVAWRSKQQFKLPTDTISTALLVVACGLLGSYLIFPIQVLAYGAFLAISGSFLWAQGDRTDATRRILLITPLLVLAFDTRTFGNVVSDSIMHWATAWSSGLLHLVNIPHLIRLDSFSTAEVCFYPAEQLRTFVAWPFFVAIACLYSGLLNRSLIPTLLNAATSFLACIVFHTSFIVITSILLLTNNWNASSLFVEASIGLVLLGVLSSADQFFAGALATIREDTYTPRTNPLIVLWNYVSQGRPSKFVDRHQKPASNTFLVVSIVALAGLLVTSSVYATEMPSAFAWVQAKTVRNWTPPADLTSEFFESPDAVDHRAFDRMVKPRWGCPSDVWTTIFQGCETQLVISQEPMRWPVLESAFEDFGKLVPANAKTSERDALYVTRFAIRHLRTKDQTTNLVMLVSAISPAGKAIPLGNSAQAEAAIATVYAVASFDTKPNERLISDLKARFHTTLTSIEASIVSQQSPLPHDS